MSYLPITKLFNISYNQIFFINQQLVIDNFHGDTCNFKYLIFKTQNNMSINEFINNLGNSTFDLTFDNLFIFSNHLILYTKLNPIKQINSNTFCIEIPWEKFNNEIVLLYYHKIKCLIKLDNPNIISEISLLIENKYFNNQQKEKMIKSKNIKPIQLFQSHHVSLNQSTYKVKSKLDFILFSRGIIIDTDINNINSFQLTCNGLNLINYDKVMLLLLSKNIGSNLYYIPFDCSIDFFNKDVESFNSGINFSNYDIITIIEFDTPIQNFSLYSLYLNYLIYENGKNSLVYLNPYNNYQTQNDGFHFSNTVNQNNNKIIWKFMNKILDNCRNTICPITYNEINVNDTYCVCNKCKYNLSETFFKEYIEKYDNKRCPICKTIWDNWTIYTNKEPDNNNIVI